MEKSAVHYTLVNTVLHVKGSDSTFPGKNQPETKTNSEQIYTNLVHSGIAYKAKDNSHEK